jgi:hypothetical protein
MIVEVSIGEAIDKYSILEIKLENIKNEIKLIEILILKVYHEQDYMIKKN